MFVPPILSPIFRLRISPFSTFCFSFNIFLLCLFSPLSVTTSLSLIPYLSHLNFVFSALGFSWACWASKPVLSCSCPLSYTAFTLSFGHNLLSSCDSSFVLYFMYLQYIGITYTRVRHHFLFYSAHQHLFVCLVCLAFFLASCRKESHVCSSHTFSHFSPISPF